MADEEVRPMNDTTVPPPRRRTDGKQQSSSSLSRKREQRRNLRKGFGLADWVQLTKSAKDLAQRGPDGRLRTDITVDEVAQHNTIHDAWMILKCKVYNIGPYLHYHPGGIDILKNVLGKDGTALFEKYHPWVNIEGLIGVLLLGYLDDSATTRNDDESRSYLPSQVKTKNGFQVPVARPPRGVVPSMLSDDNDEEEEADLDPLGR